jgi:uncharacterized YccA/Bax inhibitor family protein
VIRATPAFKRGIMAATFGIMMIYLLSWILRLPIFGIEVPYIHSSDWPGIAFSLFVVVIAAMNLVLDVISSRRERSAGCLSTWSGLPPLVCW